jgi:hypothetical protein
MVFLVISCPRTDYGVLKKAETASESTVCLIPVRSADFQQALIKGEGASCLAAAGRGGCGLELAVDLKSYSTPA